ncbi:SsrA-binding protein [Candidatus Falkowbacteria bacterium RIFOXYD2_FULL_35_9]|uniref:SsrA-binding protein n=1 Tax=Candidatus Falkowbacteria bacterium RIFOXYC2_FULL_36_12 TaxID=1798002 RepID=A0A1F5SYQ7_9BACT|nr:MAG: SsrA-binding protein [Candidatus Falkowbacteria bacterium RIFOXYB2_FULL_35_7]OGF31782.1 MAG: SsrA-binding protein [Candidatus Falkowbacteria bacterium RIFOXYC2_FULL_36_12]OGF48021.1 MAG: SsrA-binding protein [Candidatus Falkowbacteria bacterium RIFOXYD2_FULL_35_9]
MKAIVNKQARFEYTFIETFEAGILLQGHEVKSIKEGQINLNGSFVVVKHEPSPELFLINANITKYNKAGIMPEYEPTRSRKLLLHQKEIDSILGKLKTKGLTLVPIKVYTEDNLVKLEFAIAKGKKTFDKKETLKKRDIDREIKRNLKY